MGFAIFISLIFLIVFLVLAARMEEAGGLIPQPEPKQYVQPRGKKRQPQQAPAKPLRTSPSAGRTFWIIMLAALLLRMVVAYLTKGHPTDMNCWNAWGGRVASGGFNGFYAPDYFCDYPPGYMYVLGFIGWLGNSLHLSAEASALLYKMPGILADFGIACLVYRIAEKKINPKTSLLLGMLVILNPVMGFNSAVWGQIESVLTLCLLLSLYLILEKKFVWSAVLYIVAVLLKPQALLVAPVYLFRFFETKDWKMIGKSILAVLAAYFVLTIPFSPAWQEAGSFGARFLGSLNPVWLIEKYTSTLGSYNYFTINAFNFYGLLNFNWKSLDIPGLTGLLSGINWALILLAVGIAFVMFVKIKSPSGRIFLPAYMIIAFLFTFGFKMHERYLIPALLFLLMEYLFSRNRKLLYLFAGLSVTTFLNIAYVLVLAKNNNALASYSIVFPISFLEIVLFLTSAVVIVKDYILSPELAVKPADSGWFKNPFRNVPHTLDRPGKEEKMVRMDFLALAVIVIVYSVISLTNLGDTTAPQSYYKPASTSDSFIIEFKEPKVLSQVSYYDGIGDVAKKVGLTLECSEDGKSWDTMEATAQLKSVFKWELEDVTPLTAKYVRGEPQSTDFTLYEIAFWDDQGNRIEIESVAGNGESNYEALVDEQEYAQHDSTYRNGTYFDEIYHPRTAYEHLNLMPYYETTHPPLGKLIMSVGIAVFGMTPFGWRVTGTLFGIFMLPLLYLFLKKMFGRTRYSVLGTLLFAFDFMHYSLTRMGTIDSYPVFFILCMYYFMYVFGKRAVEYARENPGEAFRDRKKMRKLYGALALSGIAWGMGAASKWIAIYAGAGLAIEFVLIMVYIYRSMPEKERRRFSMFAAKICAWCVLFFVAIPAAIYTASYIPIAMTGKYGNVFQAMWDNQLYMFGYHSKLTATHPYSSKWYQWPIDYRPLWAYSEPVASRTPGNIGCISIFGNPLLWWSGIAAFIYSVVIGIKKRDKKILFLVIALAAQYLPWMFITRAVFIYHFFASTPFLVIFIIYALKDLEDRYHWFHNVSNAYVALCLLLFAAFYPVLTGIDFSKAYVETFLRWFNSWVFWN